MIRRVRTSDLPAILQIVRELKKWFEPDAANDIRRTIRNLKGYVFTEHNVVVGFVLFKTWKTTAELKWTGVRQERHSRGIGTRLYKTMERELRAKGIVDVTVTTIAPTMRYKHFVATRRFYANKGFTKLRVDEKYWKKKHDRLVMIKYL